MGFNFSTALSGLRASSDALSVAGNNIANAGNPDYTRQVATLEPSRDQQLQPGMFIGTVYQKKFLFTGFVGEGATSVIFEAIDLTDKRARPLAFKVLKILAFFDMSVLSYELEVHDDAHQTGSTSTCSSLSPRRM